MSNPLNEEALMSKADKALESSVLLLSVNDLDGACNRAYFAMLDAARAALTSSLDIAEVKTHGRLISEFSKRFVKDGPLSPRMGKLLNRGEELRLIADYKASAVEKTDEEELVTEAKGFVSNVKLLILQIEGEA